MLTRLLYVSVANKVTLPDLQRLLPGWRARNHSADVTGGICLYEDVFMQCLEGSTEAVDDLFARIDADPRHGLVRLIYAQPVARRLFPAYRMALLTWNSETKSTFRNSLGADYADLYEIEHANAVALLEAIHRTSNWSEI